MRKFSSSIFAKIFLFIIIIPFVFWGMGSMFRSGNVNTIVTIDNDKISTQEFAQFIEFNTQKLQISSLDKKLINDLLYNFIGEKLILKEIRDACIGQFYDIRGITNSDNDDMSNIINLKRHLFSILL